MYEIKNTQGFQTYVSEPEQVCDIITLLNSFGYLENTVRAVEKKENFLGSRPDNTDFRNSYDELMIGKHGWQRISLPV